MHEVKEACAENTAANWRNLRITPDFPFGVEPFALVMGEAEVFMQF
jgi:hypothetical protein